MKSMEKLTDSRHFLRKLVYIPIVHTQTDMGELGKSVRNTYLQKANRAALKRKTNVIERLWADIETALEQLNLEYGHVLIYQDGLPICGKEIDIVKDLANSGSRNHQLLLSLVSKGARLMGTESPELLLSEYELCSKILASGDSSQVAEMEMRQETKASLLLKKRDEFIARRINNTLTTDMIGILFLGILHRPMPFLDKDIEVIYPIGKPK
jgi:hypothetical protein